MTDGCPAALYAGELSVRSGSRQHRAAGRFVWIGCRELFRSLNAGSDAGTTLGAAAPSSAAVLP